MSVQRFHRCLQATLIGTLAWGLSGCASTAETMNPFRQLAARMTQSDETPAQAAASGQNKPPADSGRVTPAGYTFRDKSPTNSNCKTEGG